MRFRHRVVRNIAFAILYPYSKLKYHITVERFKEQGERPYLVLFNHQTAFDQFFVGMAFRGPIYYVASEDLFSNGFVSSLIRWLVAPIPIKKQTTDVRAVLNCIRVAREGGTVAIAPEGNRTYSGRTEYMSPVISSLAKKLRLPIALYRLEGGYGVHPRWSDKVRKGEMRGYVSKVIEPDEYASLSDDELFSLIERELYVDEGVSDGVFLSSKRAEYLERAMYVCPFCGLSEFESKRNVVRCKKCDRTVIYNEDKSLTGIGFDFPFKYVTEWYAFQKDTVNALDVCKKTDEPLYTDTASVFEVIVYKKKLRVLKNANISLFGDRIVIEENGKEKIYLPFDSVSAASVLGRNKLNIYYNDKVYQLKGSKRFNALKYVNIYYRYNNIKGGNPDGKFLGL